MYFWKVDNLVEDFKSGEVSQKEELKYLLATMVLMALISDPYLYIDHSYNVYDFTNSILMVAIPVWGIFYCYKINSAGDNKEILLRVICIGIPVLVRIMVIFFPIGIIVLFLEDLYVEGFALDGDNDGTTVYEIFFTGIIEISYYVYLAKKIRAVSS